MKQISLALMCLGLLACSDANGQDKGQSKAQMQEQATAISANQLTADWIVDTAKSSLSFSGNQSGEAFTGEFGKFDVVINFDPDDLANANVVVSIDMNSADANDAERTDALPGKEWFYVKKFPKAEFAATDFKNIEGKKFEAKGNLTIKDITQAIILPFTLKIENSHAVMDAKLSLNRNTYKIGTGMWASDDWVGHDITVTIHLEADLNK